MTEMITGINLIKEQMGYSGLPLSVKQEDVAANGHAVGLELMLKSYDDFRPSCGEISFFLYRQVVSTRDLRPHYIQGAKIHLVYDSEWQS